MNRDSGKQDDRQDLLAEASNIHVSTVQSNIEPRVIVHTLEIGNFNARLC